MPRREHILGPQEHLTPKKAAGTVALEAIFGGYGALPDVSDEELVETMTAKAQELLEAQGSTYRVTPSMVIHAVEVLRKPGEALRIVSPGPVDPAGAQEQLRALYEQLKEQK